MVSKTLKVFLFFTTCMVHCYRGEAAIILTNAFNNYSQDFNSLASTGTSSTLPDGWSLAESGTNANTTYTAGIGSSNTGETYSFGAAGSSERALGGLRSGTLIPLFGAELQINGTTQLQSLTFSYTGEQWRLGATGRIDQLDFQFSTNATSLSTGTWTDVNTLDFASPINSGTVGALDGNAAANRTMLTNIVVGGLNLNAGTSVWIRWQDRDATGADDGLAVDDFSVSANFATVPEPSSLMLIACSGALAMSVRRIVRKRMP